MRTLPGISNCLAVLARVGLMRLCVLLGRSHDVLSNDSFVFDRLLHAFADVLVHRSRRVGHVVFAVFCIVGWLVSCSGPVELSKLGSLEAFCWH